MEAYFFTILFCATVFLSAAKAISVLDDGKEELFSSANSTSVPLDYIDNEDDVGLTNGSDILVLLDANNMTASGIDLSKHAGFLHGFLEALSVIIVSELGDKTFFVAAILAMQNEKLVVFLGALSALAIMTVLSALLGLAVTKLIPPIYTYYTCTAIMFLFSIKMFYEAYKMKPNEVEEIQNEVHEQITQRNPNLPSVAEQGKVDNNPTTNPTEEVSSPLAENPENVKADEDENPEIVIKPNSNENPEIVIKPNTNENPEIVKPRKEKSLFGKKCVELFRLFVNCFTMTFLAEWGDRSQLATIVLASINDVAGITVGGILGHCICTSIAVIAGSLVAKYISVRAVTVIGALIFLGFAIASLFMYEPNPDAVSNVLLKTAVQS